MHKRSIIVHFHFFKNAGTSVETILQRNFRGCFRKQFMIYEPGDATQTFPASALIPVLEKHPGIRAISSHTICFPLPDREDWKFFPLVFIRHPMDRILSMYNFEKQQKADTPGARIARNTDAGEYVLSRLASPQERTLRNYQAWMLAGKDEAGLDADSLFRKSAAAVGALPAVGVVDQFARSIELMSQWLKPSFPGLKMEPVHRQRSSPRHMGLDERIQSFRNTVGEDAFRMAREENLIDIELYHLACQRLDSTGTQKTLSSI